MRKLVFLLFVLQSSFSYAGHQLGNIIYVKVRSSGGMIYFSLDGSKTGSPACASKNYWMIRDENSNTGKQQYAMLLAAQVAGRKIEVNGLNTCTRWPDGEDANEINLAQ